MHIYRKIISVSEIKKDIKKGNYFSRGAADLNSPSFVIRSSVVPQDHVRVVTMCENNQSIRYYQNVVLLINSTAGSKDSSAVLASLSAKIECHLRFTG